MNYTTHRIHSEYPLCFLGWFLWFLCSYPWLHTSCCAAIKTHKYQISHRSKAYSVFLTIRDETVSFLSVFICVHIRSSLLLFSSSFIILSIVIFCSRQILFHTCTLCSVHKRNDTFKSKQVTDKLVQKWKKKRTPNTHACFSAFLWFFLFISAILEKKTSSHNDEKFSVGFTCFQNYNNNNNNQKTLTTFI